MVSSDVCSGLRVAVCLQTAKTNFTRWKMEKPSSQLARTKIPYCHRVFLSGLFCWFFSFLIEFLVLQNFFNKV